MTREGDCSETMRSATLWQYTSQSGFAIVNGPVKSGLWAAWVRGVSLKGISAALTTAFSRLLVPEELFVDCPRNLVLFFSQLLVEGRIRHASLHVWGRPSSATERSHLSSYPDFRWCKYLVFTGSRNAHKEASTLDWSDEPTCAVGTEDNSHVRHILFHCSP